VGNMSEILFITKCGIVCRVDSVYGMEELFDLEYEDDMDALRDMVEDAGLQPDSRKSQTNLLPNIPHPVDQGNSVSSFTCVSLLYSYFFYNLDN